jgi:uncharacterized membrane protein
MGMLVAFFGIWLLSRRDWRAGAITAVAGIAAYFLVTEVLIPHFAGSHGTFQYWSYDDIGKNVPDAAKHVLTHPWKPFEVGLDHGRKIKTLFLMFAPFLFLSLYSRVAIIAIPILAERMLSTNELYWGTYFHYTLPLAPIVAMAAAAGLANASGLIRADLRARAVLIAAVAMVVLNVVANEGAAHTGRQLNYYRHEPSWEAAARRTVAEVPRNASVATQDFVYPHLAARKTIDIIRPGMARTEYLVFNPFVPGSTGTGNGGVAAYGRRLRSIAPQFRAVRLDDGWLIMKRRAPGDRSRGVLTAAACADLARRARTEGTKSNSKATVRLLCRARP